MRAAKAFTARSRRSWSADSRGLMSSEFECTLDFLFGHVAVGGLGATPLGQLRGLVLVALLVQPRGGMRDVLLLGLCREVVVGVGLYGSEKGCGVDAALDRLGPGLYGFALAGLAGVAGPELVEGEAGVVTCARCRRWRGPVFSLFLSLFPVPCSFPFRQ